MLRIPLGKYGVEEATRIRDKFNALRNKYKERSPNRLRSHIVFRGRGNRRGLHTRDIILKYAQEVSLYLIVG